MSINLGLGHCVAQIQNNICNANIGQGDQSTLFMTSIAYEAGKGYEFKFANGAKCSSNNVTSDLERIVLTSNGQSLSGLTKYDIYGDPVSGMIFHFANGKNYSVGSLSTGYKESRFVPAGFYYKEFSFNYDTSNNTILNFTAESGVEFEKVSIKNALVTSKCNELNIEFESEYPYTEFELLYENKFIEQNTSGVCIKSVQQYKATFLYSCYLNGLKVDSSYFLELVAKTSVNQVTANVTTKTGNCIELTCSDDEDIMDAKINVLAVNNQRRIHEGLFAPNDAGGTIKFNPDIMLDNTMYFVTEGKELYFDSYPTEIIYNTSNDHITCLKIDGYEHLTCSEVAEVTLQMTSPIVEIFYSFSGEGKLTALKIMTKDQTFCIKEDGNCTLLTDKLEKPDFYIFALKTKVFENVTHQEHHYISALEPIYATYDKPDLFQKKILDECLLDLHENATNLSWEHYSLGSNLTSKECGMSRTIDKDSNGKQVITYTQVVVKNSTANEITKTGQLAITRDDKFSITFECIYDADKNVSARFNTTGEEAAEQAGYSRYNMEMKLYKDEQFAILESNSPAIFYVNEKICVKIEVHDMPTETDMLGRDCNIQMNVDKKEAGYYELVKDGCAADASLARVEEHRTVSTDAMCFNAMEIVDEPTAMLFIVCDVYICNSTNTTSMCKPDCQDRRKRATSLEIGDHKTIASPAIVLLRENNGKSNPFVMNFAWFVAAFVISGCIAIAVVRYYNRRQQYLPVDQN